MPPKLPPHLSFYHDFAKQIYQWWKHSYYALRISSITPPSRPAILRQKHQVRLSAVQW